MVSVIVVPVWVDAVYGFGFLCAALSTLLYIRTKEVPPRVFAPVIACFAAAFVLIAAFALYRRVELLELTLVCSIGALFFTLKARAYRWTHGGEQRYREIERALLERIEQRRMQKK